MWQGDAASVVGYANGVNGHDEEANRMMAQMEAYMDSGDLKEEAVSE